MGKEIFAREEGSRHDIYKHLKGHTESGISQRRVNKARRSEYESGLSPVKVGSDS